MTSSRTAFLHGVGLVVVAATSWGCWSLFLRPSGVPALATAVLVLLAMGVTLLPFRALDDRRSGPPRWDRTSVLLLLGLAACDALNIATFFAAMSVTTLGVAVLSHYLTPLIVALLAPFVDGERVPGARGAALLGTAGLALVLEPWHGGDGGRVAGAVLGAVSAVGYAGNVFIAARLVPRIGAARSVGFHAFVSAALLLPFVPWRDCADLRSGGVVLVLAGGVTLGAISGWMFSRGLAIVGPTLASTLAFLEPLCAVIVGWLAWSERLSGIALAGAALILGAGAFVTRSRARAGAVG